MIEVLFAGFWSSQAGAVTEVPCVVDIENTAERLHAHVDMGDLEVGPGDTVIVYGAPAHMGFGQKGVFHCRAQVVRAGRLERLWVRATAYLGLTELYEVSFSPGRIA